MQRKFQQSARGACASLAVLLTVGLIGPAQAAGLSPGTYDPRAPAAQCGDADEGCARIRGHIPATSDFAGGETIGVGPPSFGPAAPLVSGLGAAGRAAADALNRGLFLLQVNHDQTVR
jgi:hypothetical protein